MEEGKRRPGKEGDIAGLWIRKRLLVGGDILLPFIPTAERQPLALRPRGLSLFIPASGPAIHVLCICMALGHQPGPLRVSWVLRGQYQEEGEDFTGGAGESHGQLAAADSGGGRDVCDLSRPAPEVVLSLPWSRGEYRGPEGCASVFLIQAPGT